MRVLPGRESIAFYKQGEITPNLQKAIPENKSKGKSITSKKILKKKNLFEIFLSEVMPGKEKEHSFRQEGKSTTCQKLCLP